MNEMPEAGSLNLVDGQIRKQSFVANGNGISRRIARMYAALCKHTRRAG